MKKLYVSMTDKFMSGWGMASVKTNKYLVECDTWEQAETIERNARKRSEMKYINICLNKPRYGSGYLVTEKTFAELSGMWKE